METCVESLYTFDQGETEKRKTQEMIRVLKGAICVSKSKAGEVTCRHNKQDQRALDRRLARYEKHATRAKLDIETKKRHVLRKWSVAIGHQKTVSDSLQSLDDIVTSALDSQRDSCQLDISDKGNSHDSSDDHHPSIGTKRVPKTTPRDNTFNSNRMPKIPPKGGFLIQSGNTDMPKEREELVCEGSHAFLNFDTAAEKSMMKGFLEEQRQLQEQLIARNRIAKLKESLDQEHSFYKLRMKKNLPDEPSALVQQCSPRPRPCRLLRRPSEDRLGLSPRNQVAEVEGQCPDEIFFRTAVKLQKRRSMYVLHSSSETDNSMYMRQRSNTMHI